MSLARKAFYEQHRALFSWYDADEYACFEVLTVTPALVQSIQQASEAIWQVLLRAGEIMQQLSDADLLAYGYLPETLALIREPVPPPFIARCDFAVVEEGIYLLECNAEVATFVVETFKMNGIVTKHFGKRDPNGEAESILKRELNQYLQVAAQSIGKPLEHCHVVFAALSQAEEDIGTVEYLRSLCECQTAFCAIEQIVMDEVGAYDQHERQIDIIYRLYPTEWMVEDKDPQLDVPLWDYLEPLLLERKVALINPISAFVLQNKALLALITTLWDAHPEGVLGATVERHFLPTFMQASQIAPPYVAKPTYGREGKEVEIVLGTEKTLYHASPDYAALPKVYQEYVDLPTVEVDGEAYTLQFSCFLVNGMATGIGARIGSMVIGNTSRFLPIGY